MKFSEVLEIRNGKNQKKVENPRGKYPIYGSGGIMGFANEYICEANTTIVGRKGNINNPIFLTEPFWNVDTAFGLVANQNILSPKYLYYFCINFNFEKLNTTVTIPSLTKANLLNIDIKIPALERQNKIVHVLDTISDLITKRVRELQLLNDAVRSRFIEMFGDPIINTMHWQKSTLNEISNKITDGTHSSPLNLVSGDYKYITAKNIKKSGFDFSNITYVSAKVHKEIYERCNPEFGDILYIKDGVTTGIAIVNTLNEEISLLSSVALIKLKSSLANSTYISAFLNNEYVYKSIRENMGGAAITRLTLKKIKDIAILLPPITLQTQFADFVSRADKSKYWHETCLGQCKTILYPVRKEWFR